MAAHTSLSNLENVSAASSIRIMPGRLGIAETFQKFFRSENGLDSAALNGRVHGLLGAV